MKITLSKALIGIMVLNVLLFIFTYFFPVTVVRAVLGIPFILFIPGFVLLSAIIPRHDDMLTSVRLILSFVLSIIVVTCIGLFLNYTFGIGMVSFIITGTIFVMTVSVIGIIRQSVLPPGDKSILEVSVRIINPASGALNAFLTVIMIVVIIGALATGIYYSVSPKKTVTFTQFYIVQQADGALYATESNDNDITIEVALKNQEDAQITYKIQAFIDGNIDTEIGPITLAIGEEWKDNIILRALSDKDTEVELQLFKNNEDKPYLDSLRIWVNERPKSIVSQ